MTRTEVHTRTVSIEARNLADLDEFIEECTRAGIPHKTKVVYTESGTSNQYVTVSVTIDLR